MNRHKKNLLIKKSCWLETFNPL